MDFHLIDRAESAAQDALHSTTQGLAATLLSVTQTTVEFGVGMALCLFAVIFLLYDGAHVWDWARKLLPGQGPQRLADAGETAWTALGVLLVEDELEAHVLQPFVVGRYVRLHPLAIVVVLALGTYQAGIVGALLVIPAVGRPVQPGGR